MSKRGKQRTRPKGISKGQQGRGPQEKQEEPFSLKELLQDRGFQLFATLFLTGILAGYAVGRGLSPAYDDPTISPLAIRHYVAETVRGQAIVATFYDNPSFEKTFYPDGRLKTVTPVVPEFTFGCGYTDYTYNGKTIALSPTQVKDGSSGEWRPRRGMAILDAFTLILGGVQSYQFRSVTPKYFEFIETAGTRGGVIRRVAGGVISLVSGFGVGVYIGYKNDPRCGEKLFHEALTDPVFWRGVLEEIKPMNTYYIGYDKKGSPLLDCQRGAGKFYRYSVLLRALRDSGEEDLGSKGWSCSDK